MGRCSHRGALETGAVEFPERAPVEHPDLGVAVGETVILLRPTLPSVGVSIWTERGCRQNERTIQS